MSWQRISILFLFVLGGVFVGLTNNAPVWGQKKSAEKKAAAAAPAAEPISAKVGDWLGEGNGKTSESPAGFIHEGKNPLVISNSKLGSGAYLVTGNVVLPAPGAAFRIGFGKEPPPVKKNAVQEAPKDDKPAPPKPIAGALYTLDKDGKTVRSGKSTMELAEGATTSLPLFLVIGHREIEIELGKLAENRSRTSEHVVELFFTLTGGAKLQDLKVIGLPGSNFVPLFEAKRLANSSVVGKKAPLGGIDGASLPRGLTSIGDVPFYFPEGDHNSLDVAASMSNVKDPVRNKGSFMSSTSLKSNGRLVFNVPGDQYSTLHIVAFSAGRSGHVPRTTVRVGHYGGSAAILEDAVVTVPTLSSSSDDKEATSIPVKLAGGKKGSIFHVRIPFSQTANVKEFKNFDLEFTRDMNAHVNPPDPNEFGKIAVGSPSDVVVLAATLETSPVTMKYVAGELGNVFNDKQKVTFKMTLTNRSAKSVNVRAFAKAKGPGTGEEYGIQQRTFNAQQQVRLKSGESQDVTLDVTPAKRGWYECSLGIDANGAVLQQRDTTFAVLAPDTRQAREDSPFGVWEFWYPHSVARQENQVEILANLMNKGGWRWTYGGSAAGRGSSEDYHDQMLKKYKIKWNAMALPDGYQRGEGVYDEAKFKEVMPEAIKKALKHYDPHFKVMHESRSSLDLLRRFSEFLGGKPYDMPAAEREKLEKQFENVRKYCLGIKKAHPDAKVVLFNDYPSVAFQFLSRKFPAEAFDAIGLEGAMFLRQPERQPDWLSLLGHMHEMKRALAHFGYDKPIWTTEALYHPTEAGALSLHAQGVISVREAMMALQLGVKRMAAAGIIKDPSDDYHWSNWGSAGFCFRDPEINPKPSYAMYAWMTQVLDQAQPAGKVATPNASLHIVDFKKKDGSHVYGIWTAKGVQEVSLELEGKPTLYDAFGNPIELNAKSLTLTASPTPHYLTGVTLKPVTLAKPVELKSDLGTLLVDFEKPSLLQEVKDTSKVLESNWDTPRLKGSFETSFVEEDGDSVMKVALQADKDDRTLLPRYVEYKLAKPITLKDRPYEFTARVKGNSGWGQIVFEMTDAKGRTWTSCGNQYAGASNAADPLGNSFVSFEGWHTMRIPIVGMYPGKDQATYWPHNYNWWPTNSPEEQAFAEQTKEFAAQFATEKANYPEALKKYEADVKQWEADKLAAEKAKTKAPAAPKKPVEPKLKTVRNMGLAPVDYPLTLTKIIVTMRPNILYLDEERPVTKPVIYLDKLGVAGPPAGM